MNRNLRLITRVLRGCRKEIWRVGQETPRGPGHHRQAWCCPGTGWTCAGKLLRPQALREMGRRGGDVGLSKHWRTGLLKHAEGLRSQPVASTCHLGVAVGWLIFFFFPLDTGQFILYSFLDQGAAWGHLLDTGRNS